MTRIGKTRNTHTISIHKHQGQNETVLGQNKTALFSERYVMWSGSGVAKIHRIILLQS